MFRALPLACRLSSVALWLAAFFSLLAPASPLVAEPTSLLPPFSCPHRSTTLPLLSPLLLGDLPASPLGHALCTAAAAVRAAGPHAIVSVSLAALALGTLALVWGWRALTAAAAAPAATAATATAATAAREELRRAVKHQSRRLALLAFALLLLAPAMGELASALSDRAVLGATALAAVLHVAAYDYSAPPPQQPGQDEHALAHDDVANASPSVSYGV